MDRKPILLSKNAVAWIQIFEKSDDIDDVMFGVYDGHNITDRWRAAAKEFVSQLKDEWCVTFMKALKSEIEEILEKEA